MTQQDHQSSELTEAERELEKLEATLYDYYCDVGKAVLENAEAESRKINDLVDQIIEKRKKLVVMRQEIECPECGVYNDSDSVHCKRCGQKLCENNREEKKA